MICDLGLQNYRHLGYKARFRGEGQNHKGTLEQSWITWDRRLNEVTNKQYVKDRNETETDFTQNEGKTISFCISGISTQVFYTNEIS